MITLTVIVKDEKGEILKIDDIPENTEAKFDFTVDGVKKEITLLNQVKHL